MAPQKEPGCSCCRSTFVAVLLLVIVGACSTGAYFAIRRSGKFVDLGNDKPETSQSGELVADNSKDVDINSPPDVRENRFYGLAYSPHGLGDNKVCPPFSRTTAGGMCLLPNQATADVRQISRYTNRIKLYSVGCVNATRAVLEYAEKHNMSVMVGLSFTSSASSNDKEFTRFGLLLETHAKSRAMTHVILGNEAVFIEKAPVATVADGLVRLRKVLDDAGASPDVKIGTAEIRAAWMGQSAGSTAGVETEGLDLTPIVEKSDFIGVNSHPYYGGIDPKTGGAAKYAVAETADVAVKYKALGKEVYITETGYPTGGDAHKVGSNVATPSVAGLTRYAADIEAQSRAKGIPVCTFDPRRLPLPLSLAFCYFTTDIIAFYALSHQTSSSRSTATGRGAGIPTRRLITYVPNNVVRKFRGPSFATC
jgi:exo-beta-1,3-glucanase (GH17 family)